MTPPPTTTWTFCPSTCTSCHQTTPTRSRPRHLPAAPCWCYPRSPTPCRSHAPCASLSRIWLPPPRLRPSTLCCRPKPALVSSTPFSLLQLLWHCLCPSRIPPASSPAFTRASPRPISAPPPPRTPALPLLFLTTSPPTLAPSTSTRRWPASSLLFFAISSAPQHQPPLPTTSI